MKFYYLNLILSLNSYFIYLTLSNQFEEQLILCRNCGHHLASFSHHIYKETPYAIKAGNVSLTKHGGNNQTFKPNFMTIQLVENPHKIQFKIATFSKANIYLVNETQSSKDTWFPNFRWTIGLCPHCLSHIGWWFDSLTSRESFFALVFEKFIFEEETNSLILEPKFKAV
jgi:hypothetical protein